MTTAGTEDELEIGVTVGMGGGGRKGISDAGSFDFL
jgi:hypothetical protein